MSQHGRVEMKDFLNTSRLLDGFVTASVDEHYVAILDYCLAKRVRRGGNWHVVELDIDWILN